MKEFEKWLDAQQKSRYIGTNDIVIEDAMAKRAWKAALEWVLSFRASDHTDMFEVIRLMFIEVEKELKG